MPFGTTEIETPNLSGALKTATNVRLIARLDVKGPNLIKGVQLEGLRKLGDPQCFARQYYEAGIDELIYMDVVASLYGRNNLTDVVRHTAENVFIPITVGGGIRSVDDARTMLRSGADKIAINTAAVGNPDLIDSLAAAFGTQCVVLSVEAIRQSDGRWEAHTDNGREKTGCDVVEWVCEAARRGAGEILLTSVDREGTQAGCDIDLARARDRCRRYSGHFVGRRRQSGSFRRGRSGWSCGRRRAGACVALSKIHRFGYPPGCKRKRAAGSAGMTTKPSVTVVDYGRGNLLSVARGVRTGRRGGHGHR